MDSHTARLCCLRGVLSCCLSGAFTDSHGASMVLSHGASKLFSWNFHGAFMVFSRTPAVRSWRQMRFHGVFVGFCVDYFARSHEVLSWASMKAPRDFRGVLRLSWCFRWAFIAPPWGFVMLSWCFHGALTGSDGAFVALYMLLWCFHGLLCGIFQGQVL